MQNLNPDPAAEEDSHLVARPIQRLSLHLTRLANSPDDYCQIGRLECAKASKLNVDTKSLSSYIRGKHRDIQDKVMDFFNKRPDLQTPVDLKDDHRELCMRQLTALVSEAGIKPFRCVVEDPAKYFVILEAVVASTCHLGLRWGCSTDAGNSLV